MIWERRDSIFLQKKNNAYEGHIPDGYEIYEHPNSQVFLRKIPPKIITELEIQTVKKALKNLTDLHYYNVDVRKSCIGIFSADESAKGLYETFRQHTSSQKTPFPVNHFLDYTEDMRFVLVDKKNKTVSNATILLSWRN